MNGSTNGRAIFSTNRGEYAAREASPDSRMILRSSPEGDLAKMVADLRGKFLECKVLTMKHIANFYDYFDEYDAHLHGFEFLRAVLQNIVDGNFEYFVEVGNFKERWRKTNQEAFELMTPQHTAEDLFAREDSDENGMDFLKDVFEQIRHQRFDNEASWHANQMQHAQMAQHQREMASSQSPNLVPAQRISSAPEPSRVEGNPLQTQFFPPQGPQMVSQNPNYAHQVRPYAPQPPLNPSAHPGLPLAPKVYPGPYRAPMPPNVLRNYKPLRRLTPAEEVLEHQLPGSTSRGDFHSDPMTTAWRPQIGYSNNFKAFYSQGVPGPFQYQRVALSSRGRGFGGSLPRGIRNPPKRTSDDARMMFSNMDAAWIPILPQSRSNQAIDTVSSGAPSAVPNRGASAGHEPAAENQGSPPPPPYGHGGGTLPPYEPRARNDTTLNDHPPQRFVSSPYTQPPDTSSSRENQGPPPYHYTTRAPQNMPHQQIFPKDRSAGENTLFNASQVGDSNPPTLSPNTFERNISDPETGIHFRHGMDSDMRRPVLASATNAGPDHRRRGSGHWRSQTEILNQVEDECKVWIGDIPHFLNDSGLRSLLRPCRGLLDVALRTKYSNPSGNKFAFLTFENADLANEALQLLPRTQFDILQGRYLRVGRPLVKPLSRPIDNDQSQNDSREKEFASHESPTNPRRTKSIKASAQKGQNRQSQHYRKGSSDSVEAKKVLGSNGDSRRTSMTQKDVKLEPASSRPDTEGIEQAAPARPHATPSKAITVNLKNIHPADSGMSSGSPKKTDEPVSNNDLKISEHTSSLLPDQPKVGKSIGTVQTDGNLTPKTPTKKKKTKTRNLSKISVDITEKAKTPSGSPSIECSPPEDVAPKQSLALTSSPSVDSSPQKTSHIAPVQAESISMDGKASIPAAAPTSSENENPAGDSKPATQVLTIGSSSSVEAAGPTSTVATSRSLIERRITRTVQQQMIRLPDPKRSLANLDSENLKNKLETSIASYEVTRESTPTPAVRDAARIHASLVSNADPPAEEESTEAPQQPERNSSSMELDNEGDVEPPTSRDDVTAKGVDRIEGTDENAKATPPSPRNTQSSQEAPGSSLSKQQPPASPAKPVKPKPTAGILARSPSRSPDRDNKPELSSTPDPIMTRKKRHRNFTPVVEEFDAASLQTYWPKPGEAPGHVDAKDIHEKEKAVDAQPSDTTGRNSGQRNQTVSRSAASSTSAGDQMKMDSKSKKNKRPNKPIASAAADEKVEIQQLEAFKQLPKPETPWTMDEPPTSQHAEKVQNPESETQKQLPKPETPYLRDDFTTSETIEKALNPNTETSKHFPEPNFLYLSDDSPNSQPSKVDDPPIADTKAAQAQKEADDSWEEYQRYKNGPLRAAINKGFKYIQITDTPHERHSSLSPEVIRDVFESARKYEKEKEKDPAYVMREAGLYTNQLGTQTKESVWLDKLCAAAEAEAESTPESAKDTREHEHHAHEPEHTVSFFAQRKNNTLQLLSPADLEARRAEYQMIKDAQAAKCLLASSPSKTPTDTSSNAPRKSNGGAKSKKPVTKEDKSATATGDEWTATLQSVQLDGSAAIPHAGEQMNKVPYGGDSSYSSPRQCTPPTPRELASFGYDTDSQGHTILPIPEGLSDAVLSKELGSSSVSGPHCRSVSPHTVAIHEHFGYSMAQSKYQSGPRPPGSGGLCIKDDVVTEVHDAGTDSLDNFSGQLGARGAAKELLKKETEKNEVSGQAEVEAEADISSDQSIEGKGNEKIEAHGNLPDREQDDKPTKKSSMGIDEKVASKWIAAIDTGEDTENSIGEEDVNLMTPLNAAKKADIEKIWFTAVPDGVTTTETAERGRQSRDFPAETHNTTYDNAQQSPSSTHQPTSQHPASDYPWRSPIKPSIIPSQLPTKRFSPAKGRSGSVPGNRSTKLLLKGGDKYRRRRSGGGDPWAVPDGEKVWGKGMEGAGGMGRSSFG